MRSKVCRVLAVICESRTPQAAGMRRYIDGRREPGHDGEMQYGEPGPAITPCH
jgi:hypothetical protein